MFQGKMIFSQLISFLPKYEFNKFVSRYRGNYKVQTFSCWDQFLCMFFAQLTYRESLRDIVTCLHAMQNKLYHMGIQGNVSRSTLADANEHRPWQIYADFAQLLIHMARQLYRNEPFSIELDETIYALDSSTIDLCLSVFPWANFRQTKAAIKLHVLLDLKGNIPAFIKITDGTIHDVNILDELMPAPGSLYLMDRAYLDFARLYQINLQQAFFIIRAKSNFQFERLYSHPVDKATGLQCDQTIRLTGCYPSQYYPDKMRRVKFFDKEHNQHLIFLTNNFTIPALTVAEFYKWRWQVELFFKWVKQHLRIKAFYGISENAVKTQIWIAIATYVLIAIVKKRLNLDLSLYTFLQILSITAFEKVDILQLVTNTHYTTQDDHFYNQLILFD